MQPFRPLQPPPWGSLTNLPDPIRNISWVQARPHLLQAFPTPYVNALAQGAPVPSVFVPARGGAVQGANVIEAARQQAIAMSRMGRAGEVPWQRPGVPPYPYSVTKMIVGPVPGLDVPNIPFSMRTHLPEAVRLQMLQLQQMPQIQSNASSMPPTAAAVQSYGGRW